MTGLIGRLVRSLSNWPSWKAWRDCALVMIASVAAIGAIAAMTSLLNWEPRLDRFSLWVFLVPALTEELVFRGPLRARGESRRPRLWLVTGTVAFTLWHVVEALTFLPGADLFLEPRFLACAAILGAACGWMRYQTGSLWPPVLFHGVVVLAWKTLFGGPALETLIQP